MQFEANAELSLTFFIDGLPLRKSSRRTFWPILMGIHTMPHVHPMTVAIFCGQSKPSSVDEYLTPLVDELNLLMEKRIQLGRNPTSVKIKVRAFIADSPARAFIKGRFLQLIS